MLAKEALRKDINLQSVFFFNLVNKPGQTHYIAKTLYSPKFPCPHHVQWNRILFIWNNAKLTTPLYYQWYKNTEKRHQNQPTQNVICCPMSSFLQRSTAFPPYFTVCHLLLCPNPSPQTSWWRRTSTLPQSVTTWASVTATSKWQEVGQKRKKL